MNSRPSRSSLVAGGFVFMLMAIGAGAIAFDSSRTLVTDWGSPQVTIGAGAVFALPFFALFLAALAIATLRAIPGRQRPAEKMGKWTWVIGSVAVLSILGATIASGVVARSLEARGYLECAGKSPLRLGVVHWRKGGLPCAG